ncbi:hypothetical protein, partial [Streptomyces thermolilacinus]|uniref:hypothetical protein n=1 Tax=Streptomyces thermolilacinus TaxID=285540 RepID=UPI0033C03D95
MRQEEIPVGRRLSRGGAGTGRTVLPGLLVVVALALTGCTAGQPPQRAAPDGPEPGKAAAVPATTTAGQRSLLHRAEQELLRACMAAAGFRFRPVPENPLPEARDFPYVVDEVRWAQRYGYGSGLRRRAERLREEDPNRVYLRGLPAERRRAAVAALNGTPGGPGLRAELPGGAVIGHSGDGCQVAAWRDLYGDVERWYEASTLVDGLGAIRQRRVLADPRFRAAVPGWAACMRRHGMAYEKPGDARAAFLGPGNGTDRAREI